jgi:hypothetical protein
VISPRNVVVAFVTLAVLAFGSTGAAVAASPWWQVTTSSRPTNLWLPKSELQELKKGPSLTIVFLGSEPVACTGGSKCTEEHGLPNDETAAQLQTSLEGVYGGGEVEVSEDPAVAGRFLIKAIGASAGRYVTPLTAGWEEEGFSGVDRIKVLAEGGSGRLAVTVTNLGDASIEAAQPEPPVRITDSLPQGLTAERVVAFAGGLDTHGPVVCAVESATVVGCTFKGNLPPYEAIELEIYASLTGDPASSGGGGDVSVTGANAAPVQAGQSVKISPEPTSFGFESYSVDAEEEGGSPDTRAGSHPFQLTTTLQFNQGALTPGNRAEAVEAQPGQPRNLRFTLPAGLVGDATKFPKCSFQTFTTQINLINRCPSESAIGAASVTIIETGPAGFLRVAVPVVNLEPVSGEPARFGFMAGGVPVVLDASVRSGEGYKVRVSVDNASQTAQLLASSVTLWGNPGDPRHDNSRGWSCVYFENTGPCERPSGLAETTFLRLPTSCGAPLGFPMEMEPWNTPAGTAIVEGSFTSGALRGCSQIPFAPGIEVQPDTHAPETPSGLAVHLTIPQEVSEAPSGIAEADVRDTKVTLPAGLKINPAAANGLQACSEAQVGYSRMDGEEAVFTEGPASCPEASKLGTVKIHSPLLEEELTGSVFQAAQGANPFGSLLALYVVAEAPNAGVRVKLAGKVEPTSSGQLISTFDATPQLPFEEFELSFFGGGGAPLATSGCGPYKTDTQIDPWSGGPSATPSSEFQVSGCPNPQPFSPSFSAGTEAPLAGAYSPFLLRLSRPDGSQQLSAIDTVLPPGMTGKLAGIPYCPEAAISRAEGLDKPGDGAVERANPSCPSASQVGTVRVGSGIGPSPVFVNGNAYLAGPYKGAPLSLVIVTPAVTGPFDLGDVVVRTALVVDPITAQITAKSDPLPTMLQGIPLDLRSIALRMDRPGFTLNPTSCERMSVTGTAMSILGQGVSLSNPFQVGGCGGLAFKPNLKISLKGSTKHTGHPALKAVLTYPKGGTYANLARAQVNLPHSEFIDQANLNKTCTRPVLLAGNCPKSSVYGKAKLWTPLLEKPLRGDVYLVGGFGYKLPALVAELDGQIRVLAVSKVDSGPNHGIRSTFETIPDAPVSRFVLEMKGGRKYSLLENSENLCAKPQKAIANFTAQNGKVLQTKPVIGNDCKKKAKGGGNKKHKRGKKKTGAGGKDHGS